MLLSHCNWKEVEHYLGRSTSILIPVGSMEQHGPNGVIGTDAMCAQAVATGVGEQLAAMVGPTIELTSAQFNLAFPGTISIRASVLQAYVCDYLRSLAKHGFRRFYFVNGHGANLGVLYTVFQDMHHERSLGSSASESPELVFRLKSWWEFDSVNTLRREFYGDAEGIHATPSEVAITQHLRGDVQSAWTSEGFTPMAPRILRELGGDRHGDAFQHRAAYPDGRVGSDPGLATPEHGRRLLQAAIGGVAEDYMRFSKPLP